MKVQKRGRSGNRGGGSGAFRRNAGGRSTGMINPWQIQQQANSDQFLLLHNPSTNGGGGGQKPQRKFLHHVRYPFVALPDTAESFSVNISPSNLTCFHGSGSIYTLQHRSNIIIDNVTYKSVDQYYQIRKVKDLLGMECEKFTDGSSNNYGNLARELLRNGSVARTTIDKWRVTAGVEVVQKALLEKLRQCVELKDELIKSGDRLLAHTYAGDDFFGTGVPAKYVNDWCKGMEEKKVVVKFPLSFPLTEETLKHVPTVGKGRNVLGMIYMILREKLKNNQINLLNVPLSQYGAVKMSSTSNNHTSMNPTSSSSGGGGAANFNSFSTNNAPAKINRMDIDFTSDFRI